MPRVEISLTMQDTAEGPKIKATGVVFTPAGIGEEMEDLNQHEVIAHMLQAVMVHHLAQASVVNEEASKCKSKIHLPAGRVMKA